MTLWDKIQTLYIKMKILKWVKLISEKERT